MAIISKENVFVWCMLWTVTVRSQSSVDEAIFRPKCAPAVDFKCQASDTAHLDFYYTINGNTERLTFKEGNYFEMSCAKTPIDDTAWPQFTRPALFQHVILKYCVPPKAPATYITALQRLNVTVLNKLVLNNLPANTNITRASLADLPSHVTSLELKATASSLQLEFDTLDGLEQLRVLDLCRVRPGRLPPHLKKLRLFYSNMRTLPSPLNDLESLFVHDGAQVDVPPLATLSKLQVLNLAVPLQAVPPLSQTLVNVTMTMFEVRSPVPFTHSDCAHVQQLTIEYWWMAQVPAGWVAACPVLHTLKLHLQKNLTELAKGMLNGTTELRVLYINACPLKTLPVDLFEYSPNLNEANLSGNKLLYLPKGLFTRVAGSLVSLDLSSNQLVKQDVCANIQPLGSLTDLLLSNNLLGDLCVPQSNDDVYSSMASCLQHNRSLRRLALSNVNATRVCVDWLRDMPHLQRLDLTRNNVTELVFSDLNRMKRNDDNSVIDLAHNPVRAVDATAEDYEASLHERPDTQGTVLLDSDFVCDCTAFWFWRALRAGRVVVRMEPRCAGGGALRELRPAAMRCAVHQARCAPCSCHAALLDAGAARLHVACAGAPPARLLLHPPSPIRALTLAGAGLTAAPDLPPLDLQWLDLDNNSISRVDAALFERARRVRLTRNPLACDCAPHSALPLLRRYRHQLEYFNETRCADGTLAADALRMQCGADEGAGAGAGWGGGAAAAALGAGAAAAALLALLLAREPLRLRLKAWLSGRGAESPEVEPPEAEPPEAERLFDVFLSHDARDRRLVAEHIAPVLEKRGYRVCLSYRDWPPGAWLPTQIEASVAASRRTVAVVSELDGDRGSREAGWGRAEVRAAHAASVRERRARLVLVALGGGVPADLRRTARHAPALLWGAPAFWDRLWRALPPPAVPAGPTDDCDKTKC